MLISGMAVGCGGPDDDSAAAPRERPRPHVLLISIDTLRADHLGCYGYAPEAGPISPAVDALASEGVRFERCFAPRGQTKPSLTSMMTGKYPSAHGIRDNGQSYVGRHSTLAELLGRFGYDTKAFVSVPGLLVEDLPTSPGRGFADLQIAEYALKGEAGAESLRSDKNDWDAWVSRRGVETIQAHEEGDAPLFLWLHMYSVHRPYAPPERYHRRFRGDYDGALRPPDDAPLNARRRLDLFLIEETLGGEPMDEADRDYAVSQYDGGVAYTDELVGDVLDALDSQGLSDDTIVIFTADHGEELGDHNGYWYHGNSIYGSTLRIPLLMRWPGRFEPGVVDGLAQNVDLLPTLAELLEEAPPPDLEGVSLAGALRAEDGRATGRDAVFVEWQDLIWSVRTDRWNYVWNPDRAHPKKLPYFNEPASEGFAIADAELYDLDADPGEQSDRLGGSADPRAQDPDRGLAPLEVLKRRLEGHATRPARIEGWHTLDPEEVARLKALGYVGTTPGRPDVYFRK